MKEVLKFIEDNKKEDGYFELILVELMDWLRELHDIGRTVTAVLVLNKIKDLQTSKVEVPARHLENIINFFDKNWERLEDNVAVDNFKEVKESIREITKIKDLETPKIEVPIRLLRECACFLRNPNNALLLLTYKELADKLQKIIDKEKNFKYE